MKKIILLTTAALTLAALNATAAPANGDAYVKIENGSILVDIVSMVKDKVTHLKTSKGLELKVSCGETSSIDTSSGGGVAVCGNRGSQLSIKSNANMVEVLSNTSYTDWAFIEQTNNTTNSKEANVYIDSNKRNTSGVLKLSKPSKNISIYNASINTFVSKVRVKYNIPDYLSSIDANGTLQMGYEAVLESLQEFKGRIAKSHRGHLARFEQTLSDGVALLKERDPKNPDRSLYGIVHSRVQENARMGIVFGSVLNELLTDYDDVDDLKLSILSMRTLVDELRTLYGWERGLAGQVSKASVTLLEVMGLELRELMSIRMAVLSTDDALQLKPYGNLIREARSLQAKVEASKSGDMRAQREIDKLVGLWNSTEWQKELTNLISAGPDLKGLVVPKLVMLLQTLESLEALSEAGFKIPKIQQ